MESLILAGLAGEYGPLAPLTITLPGGASVDVDGVAPDHSVFVEAFAHQGRMKGSQPKKVAQDALMLITIRRRRPRRAGVLAFADHEATRAVLGEGWLAEALRTWAVEVRVASRRWRRLSTGGRWGSRRTTRSGVDPARPSRSVRSGPTRSARPAARTLS